MYNFKYNPAGYMTKTSEVSGKSPFGKPMKMQKMQVCEKLVLDEPPPPGPLKKKSTQLQMVKPGKCLGSSTEVKDSKTEIVDLAAEPRFNPKEPVPEEKKEEKVIPALNNA